MVKTNIKHHPNRWCFLYVKNVNLFGRTKKMYYFCGVDKAVI